MMSGTKSTRLENLPSPLNSEANCLSDEHTTHVHNLRFEFILRLTARMFNALGDPARLRIIEILFDGQHCVSELAQEIGDSMSAISQRLKILHHAQLVSRRREGKHIYYNLADAHVIALLDNAFEHISHEYPNHSKP
jgi:DNA-binding transcriptional ArsR family regulator